LYIRASDLDSSELPRYPSLSATEPLQSYTGYVPFVACKAAFEDLRIYFTTKAICIELGFSRGAISGGDPQDTPGKIQTLLLVSLTFYTKKKKKTTNSKTTQHNTREVYQSSICHEVLFNWVT
jgi:hypothetical protein